MKNWKKKFVIHWKKFKTMFLRVISILSSLTFISRILGYIRDLLIAKILGAGLVSDAFFISFKLPNLFRRLLAEGSMNSAFIPVVSGVSKRFGRIRSDEFFSTIFSFLLIFLFIVLILFETFMPLIIKLIAPGFNDNPEKFLLTVDLSRLAFPFVFFICLTSLAGSYLNTLGKFAAMALTPIMLNLILISCLIIFFYDNDKIIISNYLSASISLAGSIQLLWIIFNVKKNGVDLKYKSFKTFKSPKNKPFIQKFLKLLLPAILGNGAYQINLLIDMILASTLPDGSISYLYFADRINQLPLGVLGIAIGTALLPILSKQIKEQELNKANESINNALKFGIFFSVPALCGIFLLSKEIIAILFFSGEFSGEDVLSTASALSALSFGLPAFILIKILVVPFFANEDTKTPISIAIFSMIINLILNLILIKQFLHVGLAIATSISAWINVILLFYTLKKKLKFQYEKTIITDFIKVLFCSVLMGIIIVSLKGLLNIDFTVLNFFGKNSLLLILIIIFGGFAYLLISYCFGIRYINLKKWKKRN